MDFRRSLHAKIEEMQAGSPRSNYSSPLDHVPFEDVMWNYFEDTRLKLQQLTNADLTSETLDTYVSEWNESTWSLLDFTVMLSKAYNIVPSAPWQQGDYKIRRTIQELLIASTNCSPSLRLVNENLILPPQCAEMTRQYNYLKSHLDQLDSLANSGQVVNEMQMRDLLHNYKAAVSSFANQYLPQLLQAEAIKVRSMEKEYHPISQAKQNFNLPEQLSEFRTLLDWALSLVGNVLSRSIEIVNQIFLYPQTTQYASLMAAELNTLSKEAVVGLCKFMLWVSSHPPMILVTRTEFTCHCLLLNNYFISNENVKVQVVSESTARQIQDQCFLSPYNYPFETSFPSAGILVKKDPLTVQNSSKRKKRNSLEGGGDFVPMINNAPVKPKSSAPVLTNAVDIGFKENPVYKMPVAEAESMLCTDRFMSDQDGSGNEKLRDIYYLHCWTNVSIFSMSYTVHALSLPFVIPTRKNQDLQLHRMLKSYSATIFWLHVAGAQDGFLFTWQDRMKWDDFRHAFNVYFTREARTSRGMSEFDFMLLREKVKCKECASDELLQRPDLLTFQNIICPHLFYQCADKQVNKHSLWRALLDLIQLFQMEKTKVREMWEKRFVGGLWSMDSVTKVLARCNQPVLMARISLLFSGSILLSFVNNLGQIVHTEPLDQQHLNRRNLADCISDLIQSENILYVSDDQLQPHPATEFVLDSLGFQTRLQVRANSDQLGCPANHKQYTFYAVKLAMIACGKDNSLLSHQQQNGTPADVVDGEDKSDLAKALRELLLRHKCTKGQAMTILRDLPLNELTGGRLTVSGSSNDDEEQSISDESNF